MRFGAEPAHLEEAGEERERDVERDGHLDAVVHERVLADRRKEGGLGGERSLGGGLDEVLGGHTCEQRAA